MRKILKFSLAFIFILAAAFEVFAWTEATLSPSELPNQTGLNDLTTNPAVIGNYTEPGVAGTGYIASNSDIDYYKFTVQGGNNAVNHDILRVQLTTPSGMNNGYGFTVYSNNSGFWNMINSGWADSGKTGSSYSDISAFHGVNHDFLVGIKSNGAASTINAYAVNITMLDSGKINGQVTLVGVGASGLTNVNLYALTDDGTQTSMTITSASGNYSIIAPVGVSITTLSAARSWYPGCAPDYSYGRTDFPVSPVILLASAGASSNGQNFKVYKEGAITGTITATYNVNISAYKSYVDFNSLANAGNTNTAYGLHNLPPGTYWMWAQPNAGYGTNQTVSYTANVSVRDGFITTVNYAFGSGWTVSGSISPPPSGGSSVEVMRSPGNTHSNDPFIQYFRTAPTGSTYIINNVPDGIFDFTIGNNGPSEWTPALARTISGNTFVNFTGPNPVTFVAGTVVDHTGSFPDMTQIAVAALLTGTADIINGTVYGYFGMCDATGKFSIMVPPDFKYYDLFALSGLNNNNGAPTFVGWQYDAVTGTAGNALGIDNGINVSGALNFINGKPVSGYDRNAGVEIFRDMGGGNYKLYDMCSGIDNYQSSTYLRVSAVAYPIVIRATGVYVNTTDISTSLLNSPLSNQNFNLDINPATDVFVPFAGYMEPCQQGMLIGGASPLYVDVGDYALGTGINSVNITSDSVPVIVNSYTSLSDNMRKYQFQLPLPQQAAGTSHDISISVSDIKGNVYNTGLPWHVVLATGTITPTLTESPFVTPTPTFTISATFSNTPSVTPSFTATGTDTWTRTMTPTRTPTFTLSATVTKTFTMTATPTLTLTSTRTATPSVTPTTPPCAISGTITLPAVSTGKQWVVFVDHDLDFTNGTAASIGGTTNGTTTISYSILSVPPGTYYIYAYVDENNSGLTGPDIGDYVGIYGGTWVSVPSSPNAVVSCPAPPSFDFTALSGTFIVPSPTPGTPAGSNTAFAYPQPAKDRITFVIALDKDSVVTVDIYDIAGNRVKSRDFNCTAGITVEMTEDVAGLRAGPYYYLIKAKTNSGTTVKYSLNKFILQK